MSNYLLARVVAAAVQVSRRAARIIRDVKISGSLGTKEKAKNDYVTIADFNSQMCIIKSLEKMFPKLNFCGEEGDLKGDFNDLENAVNDEVLKIANNDHLDRLCPTNYRTIKEEELVVWVDPLDGTKEYTMSEDYAHEVTILIGIAYMGRPIAGIVNQPFYTRNIHDQNGDRVIWAIEGLGAYHNSSDRSVFEQLPGRERKMVEYEERKKSDNFKYKVITTRSHLTDLVKNGLESIPLVQLSHCGGSGYKTLCVIDGSVDCYLYPRNGTKRWDTCAVEAVLRSIGGQFTDIFNKSYDYSKPKNKIEMENSLGVIASLVDHEYYVNNVNNQLKENVQNAHLKLLADSN